MAEKKKEPRLIGIHTGDLEKFKSELRGMLWLVDQYNKAKASGKYTDEQLDEAFRKKQSEAGFKPQSYNDYAKRARNIAQHMNEGLLGSFSDEYGSGMNWLKQAVLPKAWEPHRRDSESFRLLSALSRETNPKTARAAKIGGTTLGALETMGPGLIRNAAVGAYTGTAAPIKAAMGRGTVFGGGTSFIEGAGAEDMKEGEGLMDNITRRLKGGAAEAPIGALIGSGLGLAGAGLGGAIKYAKTRLAPNIKKLEDQILGNMLLKSTGGEPRRPLPGSGGGERMLAEAVSPTKAKGIFSELGAKGANPEIPMRKIDSRVDTLTAEAREVKNGIWKNVRDELDRFGQRSFSPNREYLNIFKENSDLISKAAKKLPNKDRKHILGILEKSKLSPAQYAKGKPVSMRWNALENLRYEVDRLAGAKNPGGRANPKRALVASELVSKSPKKVRLLWEDGLNRHREASRAFDETMESMGFSKAALEQGGVEAGRRAVGTTAGKVSPFDGYYWVRNVRARAQAGSLYTHELPKGIVGERLADKLTGRLTSPGDIDKLLYSAKKRNITKQLASELPYVMTPSAIGGVREGIDNAKEYVGDKATGLLDYIMGAR